MSKEIVLATIAFTFGMGGAFASMLADESVYVYAKRSPATAAVCVQTNKMCDDTPSSCICQIEIAVTKPGIGFRTATSNGTFKTFKSGCTDVLFDQTCHSQPGAMPISGSIYDLEIPEE